MNYIKTLQNEFTLGAKIVLILGIGFLIGFLIACINNNIIFEL